MIRNQGYQFIYIMLPVFILIIILPSSNKFFQQMNQDDFEILFTTDDYKKLQLKCNEHEKEALKLAQENKVLTAKIYSLTDENNKLQKKITKFTQDIKYLSQKGLQMSKTLLDMESSNHQLKFSIAQTQKSLAEKYLSAIKEKEIVEKNCQKLMEDNESSKTQLLLVQKQFQKFLNKPFRNCMAQTQLSSSDIEENEALMNTKQRQINELSSLVKELQNSTALITEQKVEGFMKLEEAFEEKEKMSLVNKEYENEFCSLKEQIRLLSEEKEQLMIKLKKQGQIRDNIENMHNIEIQEKEDMIKKLSQQIENLQSSLEKQQKKKSSLIKSNSNITSELDTLANQNAQYEGQINLLSTQTERLMAKLKEEHQNTLAIQKKAQSAVSNLQQKIQIQLMKNEALNGSIQMLTQQVHVQKQKYSKLNSENEDLKNKLQKGMTNSKVEENKKEKESFIIEVKILTQKFDKIKQQNKILQQKADKIQHEKRTLIAQRETMEKQYEQIIGVLEKQIKQMENQLKEKKNKGKGDSLQHLKEQIHLYFSNILIGLIQLGDMKEKQIEELLSHQRKNIEIVINECSNPSNLKRRNK